MSIWVPYYCVMGSLVLIITGMSAVLIRQTYIFFCDLSSQKKIDSFLGKTPPRKSSLLDLDNF